MDMVADIRSALENDWLPSVYDNKVRTQRTRSVSLEIPERENEAEIQHTLLGIELRVGRRRFPCPDLAAARYMRVFARIGCRQFAIPYDITRVSGAADELETSWQRTLLLLSGAASGRTSQSVAQLRSKLVRTIREELRQIGPGDAMPAFDRRTRQGRSGK
jgi:hypothetical protein